MQTEPITQKKFQDPVFFIPGDLQTGRVPLVLATAFDADNGAYLHCDRNGRTIADLRKSYPEVYVVDLCDAFEAKKEFWLKQFEEIDRARFIEMLEVLPPVNWCRRGDSESFHLSELRFDNIAIHLCRVEQQYFMFNDDKSMTHEQIVARVRSELQNTVTSSIACS